jgi:hypothetical protein
VQALQAMHGVQLIAAMTLVAALQEFLHFGSARQLMAFGLWATTTPNSASSPRMRLMQPVRSSLKPSCSRYTHCMLCCSTLLTGTKRLLGLDAAS